MLMRHLRPRLCVWRKSCGAIPVEYSIVRSVDLVVHSFSSCIGRFEYHDVWCALKSPRIRVSGVVRTCSIEDRYPVLQELAGGM